MYFVCPECNAVSWCPMGIGIDAIYKQNEVIIPQTILNKRKIVWNCKCVKLFKNEKKHYTSSDIIAILHSVVVVIITVTLSLR